MSGPVAVGIDVGGTKVGGLVVDASRQEDPILDRLVVETPAMDAEALAGTIVGVVRKLMESNDVAAVGIGSAGLVGGGGVLRFAPNLAWRDFPLKRRVEEEVGLPTLVDNDATVAAWGEYRFGAGRGSNHMLLVTVGTGIGGGIVADGRLLRGAHGFAGEIGHIIVDPDGPLCGCGNRGCWEQVASGRAIDRLGREAVSEHPESGLARLTEEASPQAPLGPMVTVAAREHDPVAIAVLREVGRRLGEGIAGLVNTLDPDLVVVGGGAVAAGDLLLDPTRKAFAETVEGVDYRPKVPIAAARLGNDAGAVGAADIALLELVPG